jgi:hypothetical protein
MPKPLTGLSLCSMLLAAAALGFLLSREPAVASAPQAVPTARERCAAVPVEVVAATGEERRLACAAAGELLARLARCGIGLQRPLQIRVGADIPHAPGRAVVGLFDRANQRLYVRELESIPALVGGTPFAEIPPPELFKSMIIHEIAHAVLHQNAGPDAVGAVGHEYLAYALQIESLPAGARERFLQAVGKRQSVKEFVFNDVLLDMNPCLFAAYAFEHLAAAGERCAPLVAILEGEPDFVATSSLF